MKITAIKQQARLPNRYSVFLDDKYGFSLSDTALLESKLVAGQDLNEDKVREFKQLSSDDKLYNAILRYVAIRPRTQWEIETYLKRKKASPALSTTILNKLSVNELLDDERFARAWVKDRQLLRPTSRRKLILELRQKHVNNEIIQKVMAEFEPTDEQSALAAMVASKRRQAKYQDDTKLMQYLARQGFGYGDIKAALNHED
jgi:regulatory protein